jgi:hypothetical protein
VQKVVTSREKLKHGMSSSKAGCIIAACSVAFLDQVAPARTAPPQSAHRVGELLAIRLPA